MKIEIVTPNGIVFNGEGQYFTARGESGEFAVLENHIPMVSAFKSGFVKVVAGKEQFFFVESVIVEFRNNVANIMAQTALEGTSFEDVLSKYKQHKDDVQKENKKQKVDYTKIERDLQKSIKEAKAGH